MSGCIQTTIFEKFTSHFYSKKEIHLKFGMCIRFLLQMTILYLLELSKEKVSKTFLKGILLSSYLLSLKQLRIFDAKQKSLKSILKKKAAKTIKAQQNYNQQTIRLYHSNVKEYNNRTRNNNFIPELSLHIKNTLNRNS